MSTKETFCTWAVKNNENGILPGFDGGDAGSPQSPSVWVFGLEMGWSKMDDEDAKSGVASKRTNTYSVDEQLAWIACIR